MIEVLHPRSFVDDPTRMFRALRYVGRYGFQMAHDTAALLNDEARAVLAALSGQRLRHEFERIFDEQRPAPILSGVHYYDLLHSIQPALASLESALILDEPPAAWGDFKVANILTMRQSLGWLTWLLPLSGEQALAVSERLAFPVLLTRALRAASALRAELPSLADARPSAWTFRLDEIPSLAVYAVYLRTQTPALRDYLSKWRFIQPRTHGDDLKALGLPPGPRYQEILACLRAAWLDGELKNVGDEKKLLETFFIP
jgi:tRNA nucleotidyltransferase (CCA-adding enzyme)